LGWGEGFLIPIKGCGSAGEDGDFAQKILHGAKAMQVAT
jgi:hypothetical protein